MFFLSKSTWATKIAFICIRKLYGELCPRAVLCRGRFAFASGVHIHFGISILKMLYFYNIKMIVLTIITQTNGETVYFDKPIPRVYFMKLISCSLYKSWHNLKREGSAALGDEKDPSVWNHDIIYSLWSDRQRKNLHKTKSPLGIKICMNISFQPLLHIVKVKYQ